jgi:hypothetical protein
MFNKELANKAFSFAWDICKKEGRKGGEGDHIWVSLAMGKLCELTVNECIQTIDRTTPPSNSSVITDDWTMGYNQAMIDCVNHIKVHFDLKDI